MKREINRRSQHKTIQLESGQEQMAEHLRLAHRHALWMAAHMKAMYDLIKPADAPEIEDPNQLKLFDDGNQENS